MSDAKFWSDDFDMDLPKVVPGTRDLLGDLADLVLFTHGGSTHGRLNHPTVWNTEVGTTAFVGLQCPVKPAPYVTMDPVVECTLWELVRDAWAHDYYVIFEGDTCIWIPQWQIFSELMNYTRGWRNYTEGMVEGHLTVVRAMVQACEKAVRWKIQRVGRG